MTNLLELVRGLKADLGRGKSLLDHGKFDEAAAVLQRYDGLFPKDIDLLLQRARLAYFRNDFAGASLLFERLLALDPYHGQAASHQATCLAMTGRRPEAIALLETVREAKPDHAMVLETYLPLILADRGLDAALAALRAEYRRRSPAHPPIIAAEVLRQKALSLLELDEVRAADPDNLLMIEANAKEGYSLRAIYPQFEPVGCNCEFGMVQRHHGVEPLSLFRWTAIRPENLTRLLESRLEGYDDPAIYALQEPNGREYILHDSVFDTKSHTGTNSGDLAPEEFLDRVVRRQGFLKRKFLQDAAEGKKVFVYKANRPLTAEEIEDVDCRLVDLGVRHRLYVMFDPDASKGGTFEMREDGRMIGYISRIMPDTVFDEWDRIVVAAYDHFIGRA